MDTLKILLGATVALLTGALFVSVKRMNEGVKATPADQVAELRREILELEQEMQRLELERERKLLQELNQQPSSTDAMTRGEAKETVEELEDRLARVEKEAAAAKEDAERAEAEAGFVTGKIAEDRNRTARRVRVINDAMKIATIREWVEDPEFGGFAVLAVDSPENVQTGTVLAIRRNGGILGRLRVGEMTVEGAVANPVSSFGEVKPVPGDELILDEVVKLAN